jgi:L-ascorbate metabolism protein UlaG (beta-lactamase superfamily)
MRIRYLGHSCIEIVGKHHILIDPDFTRDPKPGVEYVLITHAHMDHVGRVADVPKGKIIASPDTCRIAGNLGVSEERLNPVEPGAKVGNIQVLPGFSQVNNRVYTFFHLIFRRQFPAPGGTPLSFLVEDEVSILHIGDAHKAALEIRPDILCLPWRTTPFGANRYKRTMVALAEQFQAQYILPIHYDLPYGRADPADLHNKVSAKVLDGTHWHTFQQNKLCRT